MVKLMDRIGHSIFEEELLFPPEAAETAYIHVGFNWNPHGHGPETIFTEGHYDVHFLPSGLRHPRAADGHPLGGFPLAIGSYTLPYDPKRQEFDIVLDDLVYRQGTPIVAAS